MTGEVEFLHQRILSAYNSIDRFAKQSVLLLKSLLCAYTLSALLHVRNLALTLDLVFQHLKWHGIGEAEFIMHFKKIS